MNQMTCYTVLKEVFAAFQRNQPRDDVLEAIYRQVEDLPDEFCVWAGEQLKDFERLPMNLGRELRRSLLPAWELMQVRNRQADLGADAGSWRSGREDCPECRALLTDELGTFEIRGEGWHYVWPLDAKPGSAPTAIPCVCNYLAEMSMPGVRKMTRQEVQAAGIWTYRRPEPADGPAPMPMKRTVKELLDQLKEARDSRSDDAQAKADPFGASRCQDGGGSVGPEAEEDAWDRRPQRPGRHPQRGCFSRKGPVRLDGAFSLPCGLLPWIDCLF